MIKQLQDRISKALITYFVKMDGRGPENIRTYIVDDLVIVRVTDNFGLFGKVLLRRKDINDIQTIKDIYRKTRELSISLLHEVIEHETGLKVISSHHDISTVTAERMEIFVLEKKILFTKTQK